MNAYAPIACADHERLEYAALRREWLDLTVATGAHAGRHRLMPVDVYTHDSAEWLRARTETGDEWVVRLDELAFEPAGDA